MAVMPNPGIDVYEYILEKIDTVPQLEAVILLWNSRPVGWTADELASRLYIPPENVTELLQDLIRQQLVQQLSGTPQRYSYVPRNEEQNEWMYQVDTAYRRDLVRISTMLHAKTSSSVREFARAFRIKKIARHSRGRSGKVILFPLTISKRGFKPGTKT
jgi:predicted ArsR family transcriptional regulator